MNPVVRRMARDDVESVVRIHMSAFPGFFLTSLGERFLRLFYAGVVDCGELGFVLDSDGRVDGFVVGSAHLGRFYLWLLLHRGLHFAVVALPAVTRTPAIVHRLLRALNRPFEKASKTAYARLMSVAVSPGAQGRGGGRMLVQEFVSAALEAGSLGVDLETDALNNDKVNAFYRQLGFIVDTVRVTSEGRAMNHQIFRKEGALHV